MRKKKLLIIAGTALLLLLLVLIIVIALRYKKYNQSAAADSVSKEVTVSSEGTVAEEKIFDPTFPDRNADEEKVDIDMEITPMAREVMGSWSYLLVEAMNNYAEENQIEAQKAEIIAYGGLDTEESYIFYVQMDDVNGTILEMQYKNYKITVKKATQTLEEILSKNYDPSDDEMDSEKAHEELEKQWEEEEAAVSETVTPTKAAVPEMPNSSIQILDIPTELADRFQNPAAFASTLAGYLTTIEQDPNQSVYYADSLKENKSKISFLVTCEDGTEISVKYDLKTETFSYSKN